MGEISAANRQPLNGLRYTPSVRRVALFKKGNNLTCDNLPPRTDREALSIQGERLAAGGVSGPVVGAPESKKRNPVFVKTRMCPWHFKGCCDLGSDCRFAHSRQELRCIPDLSKTSLCPRLMRQKLCTMPDCTYAHHQAELRTTQDFYKTSLCHMWQRGRCSAGKRCRHAHGEEELRFEVMGADGAKCGWPQSRCVGSPISSSCRTTCDGLSTVHGSDTPPAAFELGPESGNETNLLLEAAALLLEDALHRDANHSSQNASPTSAPSSPPQFPMAFEALQTVVTNDDCELLVAALQKLAISQSCSH